MGPFDSIWWRDVARVGDSTDVGFLRMLVVCWEMVSRSAFGKRTDRFPDNDHNQEWNWFWSVELSEFEMKEVEELQILLNGIMITGDNGDKWRWIPGEK
ncbi:hypothetical protein L195_g051771, partial [Trifolium pratense]